MPKWCDRSSPHKIIHLIYLKSNFFYERLNYKNIYFVIFTKNLNIITSKKKNVRKELTIVIWNNNKEKYLEKKKNQIVEIFQKKDKYSIKRQKGNEFLRLYDKIWKF